MRERKYSGASTNNNDALPAYLNKTLADDGYDYVVQGTSHNIWLPNYGNTYVRDRYIALMEAIASRFDGHPKFEGIRSGEQGTYGNGTSTWRENFTVIAEQAKAALVRSTFWAPTMNPSGNMSTGQLTRIFVDAKAGQYLIDTPPHEFETGGTPDGWSQYAMAHHHEYPLMTCGEVGAWRTALTNPLGNDDVDPESYYLVAVGDLAAHHVAWQVSASKLRAGWWTDVVSYLENGGDVLPTNTRVPASISGNIIANFGFENGLGVEWTAPNPASETGLTRYAGNAKSGTYSLRAVASGSYGERSQMNIPVKAGTTYTITHSIRVDSVSGNGFSFRYDWFDSSGTMIGSTVAADQTTTTSGYVTKTAVDTAPTGAVSMRVRCIIRAGTSSGTAYFDDISVLPNLMRNAGFEDALGSEWSGASSLTRQSGNAHSGSYALKAVASGSAERAQVNIPVNAGQTYTIGGYIRVDSVTGTGFSIKYNWYDSSGTDLGTASLDQTSTTSGYVQKSTTVTAPTGAVTLKIRCIIKAGTTAGTAYFDDIGVY